MKLPRRLSSGEKELSWKSVKPRGEKRKRSDDEKKPLGIPKEAGYRMKYKLSAVVRHLGDNANSGHYVTDLPDNDYKGSAVEGKWRRCDDRMIRPITLDKVLAEQDNPYLLFYTFVDHHR